MTHISIKIKNYKCFEEASGFDVIKRVNLIIGRNNVGKSALVDLIEGAVRGQLNFSRKNWYLDQEPEIIFSTKISREVAEKTYPNNASTELSKFYFDARGKSLIGKKITWARKSTREELYIIDLDDSGSVQYDPEYETFDRILPSNINIGFEGKSFRRLLAEREIKPEADIPNTVVQISPNGDGLTNAIQRYINIDGLPRNIVQRDMLAALNKIFAHDINFDEIVCRKLETNAWEIFLGENKNLVALSQSGSGIKTVLCVLTCIYLVPHIENKSLENYVFAFEELENSIHPALLRRLVNFIDELSKEKGFIFFLATHSSVLIDQFSKAEDAQIVHVTKKESSSICVTAQTYFQNNGILDDLDIRASDLLQSNGIIWVEGPSDRIYMNQWIKLWSDGLLKEGTHYQILFYGGRLLSHLSATDPTGDDKGIYILNANRNAILLIDSDIKFEGDSINSTKARIKREFEHLGSLCWETYGREIENYIPASVLGKFLDKEITGKEDRYASFFTDSTSPAMSGYSNEKPLLAEKLTEFMTDKKDLESHLDLDEKMTKVCEIIRSWNR